MPTKHLATLSTLLTLAFLCQSSTSLASWLEEPTILDDDLDMPKTPAQVSTKSNIPPKKRTERSKEETPFNLFGDEHEAAPPTPAASSVKKKAKAAKEDSDDDEQSFEDINSDEEFAFTHIAPARRKSIPRKTKEWYEPGMYKKLAEVPLENLEDGGIMDYMDGIEEILADQGIEMDDDARDLLISQVLTKKSGLQTVLEKWAFEDDDAEYDIAKALLPQSQTAEVKNTELNEWMRKIEHIRGHEEAYKKALELAKDLTIEDPSNEAAAIKKKILSFMCELPWDRVDNIEIDLLDAQQVLDKEHYGLQKPKERIIEFLAVQKRNPEQKGKFICFVGPPGVGKTTLSESIAKATGRKFVSVALGGVHDEADIRGSLPVYVSSYAGRILHGLRTAGTSNPVMLLDEIEKLGQESAQGNPAHALLEVLDPAQNNKFKDNYIGVPYDLSKILFICSANTLDKVPAPLLDRLEIIELSSYTPMEKLQIARRHLRPKVLKEAGAHPNELGLSSEVLQRIIAEYTSEAGVRELKRQIEKIARKVVTANMLRKAKGEAPVQVIMKPEMLETYLGPSTQVADKLEAADTIGCIQGMAATDIGGFLTPIQVGISVGKGEVAKTGQLGKVLKESVDSALTVVKRILPEYGMTEKDIADKSFHIHLSDASSKKEGPSAGAGITAAILSAVTKIPIKRDVSITGEINLLGQVKAIGGLKEKLIAAFKAGIKTVIIPKDNMPELVEVPIEVVSALQIVPVSEIREVLKIALARPEEAPKGKAKTGGKK